MKNKDLLKENKRLKHELKLLRLQFQALSNVIDALNTFMFAIAHKLNKTAGYYQ
jgi:hypothetical protein